MAHEDHEPHAANPEGRDRLATENDQGSEATEYGGRYARPRLSGRGRAWLLLAAVLVVLAAAGTALVGSGSSFELPRELAGSGETDSGQVLEGVEVSGVPLGSESPEEARLRLGGREAEVLRSVGLDGPNGGSLEASELGVRLDVAATAERAQAVGREGNVLQRLQARVTASAGGVAISPQLEYSPVEARTATERFVGDVDRLPRPASVEIRGSAPEVVPAQSGYAADLPGTVEDVEWMLEDPPADTASRTEVSGRELEPGVSTQSAQEAAGEIRAALSAPLTLSADAEASGAASGEAGGEQWRLSPEQLGGLLAVEPDGEGGLRSSIDQEGLRQELSQVYSAQEQDSVEAGYELDGETVQVSAGRAGSQVSDEELAERMEEVLLVETGGDEPGTPGPGTTEPETTEPETMEPGTTEPEAIEPGTAGRGAGEREIEVPVETAQPDLTTERAEELRPTAVLSEYRTPYTWDDDPGRTQNLRTGAAKIDGTFIAPGEVFSYNQATAPLSDYSPAKVIFDGAVDYSPGGGLSQLSSNTFMAAALADLEILEEHPHTAELPYIRPGLDTTVWFGELDLRFRNTTGSYLLLRSRVSDDGYVYTQVRGMPADREVEITSEKISEQATAEGATTRWEAYKSVTEGGEEVSREVLRTVTYTDTLS